VTVKRDGRHVPALVRRGDLDPLTTSIRQFTLSAPVLCREGNLGDRVYAWPEALGLDPGKLYRISGRVSDARKSSELFAFTFYTDSRGVPVVF
jgi:hypothetical protein